MNEVLGMWRQAGGEITIIEAIDGLVGVEFREDQAQMVKKNEEEEEEKQFLSALALFGEIIVGQCQLKLEENQDVNQLTELATLKINETNKIKELYKVIGEFTESEKRKAHGRKTKGGRRMGGNGRN